MLLLWIADCKSAVYTADTAGAANRQTEKMPGTILESDTTIADIPDSTRVKSDPIFEMPILSLKARRRRLKPFPIVDSFWQYDGRRLDRRIIADFKH